MPEAPTADPSTGALAAELGVILRAARGATPLRQQARQLGLVHATLAELEGGHANPTLARVEAVAAGYGLRVALVPIDGDPAALGRLDAELDGQDPLPLDLPAPEAWRAQYPPADPTPRPSLTDAARDLLAIVHGAAASPPAGDVDELAARRRARRSKEAPR